MPKELRTAACYFRYSSSKTAQVENSESRQREVLRLYCAKKEWDIIWIGGDEKTSGDRHKPVLMKLKKEVEDKQILPDVIVVTSWDRLTRRGILDIAPDVKWIKDAGVLLCLQQEDKIIDLSVQSEQLMLSFRASEAHSYLVSLSKNVIGGQVTKFRAGTLGFSNAPFGYDLDGSGGLVANKDLLLVPLIFECVASSSIVAAIDIMRRGDRYQLSGRAPSTAAVKSVLRNTIYIGKRTFGVVGAGRHGTIRDCKTKTTRNVDKRLETPLPVLDVSDKYKPVIAESLFNRVQLILDANKVELPKHPKAKYKYSGFVRCSCGAKLIAEMRHRRINYVCPRSKNLKAGCDTDVIGRKTLYEGDITRYIKEIEVHAIRDEKFHFGFLRRIHKVINRKRIGTGNQTELCLREIEELKKRRSRLFDLIISTGADADEQIRQISKKISDLEMSLSRQEVDTDSLLELQFDEATLDPSGGYLKLMIKLGLETVDIADSNDQFRAMRSGVHRIMRSIIKGNQFFMEELLDGLTVTWKKAGSRCVPWRIVASWSGADSKTIISPTKERGVSGVMGAHIVYYPTKNRVLGILRRNRIGRCVQ